MPLITADRIFTPRGWLTDHVLELDVSGVVEGLRPRQAGDRPRPYEGVLAPGLVNVHCHLELSFLDGEISTGTGMAQFAAAINEKRESKPREVRRQAAAKALAGMAGKGTVLLGDICNSDLTIGLKRKTKDITTHSFIEVFGLEKERAGKIFDRARELAGKFEGLAHSLTPHAPYSCSSELLEKVYSHEEGLLSIHLLESQAERSLFQHGEGGFIPFFESLGLSKEAYPSGDPIDWVTRGLETDRRLIFVHNTEATEHDYARLTSTFDQAWFCLCPRSNYFIHRRLPDIQALVVALDRICLGTDSLASNYSVNVFDEVKMLAGAFPVLNLQLLLRWATYNGALALGQGDKFGSFTPGTRPGVVLISPVELYPEPHLLAGAEAIRLF